MNNSAAGQFIQNHDWLSTSLGSIEKWPHSLHATLNIVLNSEIPMFMLWGRDFLFFSNDAYNLSLTLSGRNIKDCIGRKGYEVLGDSWDTLVPISDFFAQGLLKPVETFLPLFYGIEKNHDEKCSVTCSPLINDNSTVAGILVTCKVPVPATATFINVQEKEEQPSKGEIHFRSLIKNAPVAIALFNTANLVIDIANEVMLGYWGKGHDIVGKTLQDIMPELEGQGFIEKFETVFTSGIEYKAAAQKANFIQNGILVTKYFDYTLSPLFDAEGNVISVLNMAVDVSEQMKLVQAKIESEAHLQLLRDTVPAMIFYLDKQQRYVSLNKVFLEWFDTTPAEALGKTVREFLGEATYEKTKPHLDIVYGGVQEKYELFAPTRMGGQRWLSIVYTPHIDNNGEVIGAIVHATDITQSKQAEKALRSVIDLAQLGTWTMDIATGNTIQSERHAEMFGLKQISLSVTEAMSVLAPEDVQHVTDAFMKAQKRGSDGKYEAEYRIINATTGKVQVIHAQGQTYFDEQGNPVTITGTARDVTIQKELQTALENEVQLRTNELDLVLKELKASNSSLEKTNSDLKRSNQELSQYAYVASHDLQEPLRKIRFFTGLLKDGTGRLSTDELIEKINRSAQRMSGLISDLLSFSRLLETTVLIQPVDLNAVVRSVWDDFELVVQEKDATIVIGALPVIDALGLQMNQLFYNLISNSLKFTNPQIKPVITLSYSLLAPETVSDTVAISVPLQEYHYLNFKDNGIGFETRHAEQIFEIFKRLHGDASYLGSGIGLALCKRIVTNHHGFLYAESEPGKGSVFHILLPVHQQAR